MHGPDWYYHDALDDLREKILLDNTYNALAILNEGAALIQNDHLRTKFTNFLQPFNQIFYVLKNYRDSIIVPLGASAIDVLSSIKKKRDLPTELQFIPLPLNQRANLLMYIVPNNLGTNENPLQVETVVLTEKGRKRQFEKGRDDVDIGASEKQPKLEETTVFAFWTELKGYQFEYLRDEEKYTDPPRVIALNTNLVGDDQFGKSLFVRPYYYPLSELILQKLFSNDETPAKNLAIMGTPGIGKTFFGFFLLYVFAKMNKTVVYQRKDHYRILFSGDVVTKAWKGTERYNFWEMDLKGTIYIVDGAEPTECSAQTILLSSPRMEKLKEYLKYCNATFFMPTWTMDEIEACNELVFNKDLEEVKAAFSRWGGIPRYVLYHLDDPTQQQELQISIESTGNKSLSDLAVALRTNQDFSHHLIHMAVKSGFIQYEYRFASRFVEEGVMERIQSSTWDHLFGFVKDTKSLGEAASFRGVLFERVAHYKLQQGGTFQTRRLNDNISENLVIGPWKRKSSKRQKILITPTSPLIITFCPNLQTLSLLTQ
jgi:hypothetical protein